MIRFLIKLSVFLALIAGGQWTIRSFQPDAPLPKTARRLTGKLARGANIVYFGDSVDFSIRPAETNRATVAQFLQSKIPGNYISDVSRGAYQMEMFFEHSRFLIEEGFRPEAIVIEVNMGGFVPVQPPTYHFQGTKAAFRRLRNRLFDVFYKPLFVFHSRWIVAGMTHEEYLDAPVYKGKEKVGRIWDFYWHNPRYAQATDENKRRQVIIRYLYNLQPDNPKLVAMRNTARLLKKHGIPAVFYVTPVNIEWCEAIMPGELRPKIEQDISTMKNLLAEEGFELLDLSFDLGDEFFAHDTPYPNEHLSAEGRAYVAQEVAKAMPQAIRNRN